MSAPLPESEATEGLVPGSQPGAGPCASCGEPLLPEEEADPLGGADAPDLCDECYREFYQYACCWCEDYDDNDHQHVLLVVFDPEAAGIALPGVYQIDALPYYEAPMIGAGRLWEEQLTWLGYLPACHDDGYACGHLCRRCQAKALAQCLYDTRCGALAVLA